MRKSEGYTPEEALYMLLGGSQHILKYQTRLGLLMIFCATSSQCVVYPRRVKLDMLPTLAVL